MKIRGKLLVLLMGLAAVVMIGWVLVVPLPAFKLRMETLDLLDSPQAADRQKAAWIIAEEGLAGGVGDILKRIRREDDPDTREAYLYALGRVPEPRSLEAVVDELHCGTSGYPRHAAWLALARIDPAVFRSLSDKPPILDPWDRLGIAHGRLEVDDTRGVETIIEFALRGDADQRRVACTAIGQLLHPLLESAGRWPLESPRGRERIFPAAFVCDISVRCDGIDLQSLADWRGAHGGQDAAMSRSLRRLNNARNRIAYLLFGSRDGAAGQSLQ
ncbi:hypothetical protein RAS1_44140 [Phycisphaerae bacterium RAS1]|nr:hypothetical protein RAS1_44140 [Phycisphaerae bacterium RAS1]